MTAPKDPHVAVPELIDSLVCEEFVIRKFNGVMYADPTPTEIMDWMDEHVLCEIHDSGPAHLVEMFAQARYDYLRAEEPYPYCEPRGGDRPDLEPVSGEIPWRTLHTIIIEAE